MKRCILIAALIASPAFAQNIEVFVVDEGGDGVVQYESPLTLDEAAVMMDSQRPSNATGVILEKGKLPKWTNLSPEGVNEQYGGDDEPFIVNRDDETANDDMTFDASEAPDPSGNDEAAGDDMTFEDPADPNQNPTPATEPGNDPTPKEPNPSPQPTAGPRITLEDGPWFGDFVKIDVTGCPAPVKSTVENAAAALNGSVLEGQIDANFHPTQISTDFTWTENGPNSWSGLLDQRSPDGAGATVQWFIYVRAPDLIENRQVTSFYLPGATCRSDLKFYYHKP